jgi:uncharacterized repeat protein (TIGR03837 family)
VSTSANQHGATWDIFCKVVDNYGDVGVALRLARELAAEHGLAPRLWVDDLGALARLRPDADPRREAQTIAGVEVRRWSEPFPPVEPGAVVVETFQCNAPDGFVAAMAARDPKPAWINLDYLSAEDWVAECHARPSPHPRLPLTRWFYFPGFDARTGGLLRERGLDDARRGFVEDPAALATFWHELGTVGAPANELRVSLFCYAAAPVRDLLAAIAAGSAPTRVIVPQGQAEGGVADFFDAAVQVGSARESGNLTVQVVPFLSQDRYDRLLWACDVNFVRGEDSLVRAHWAEKPFFWNAYPQDASAHWIKLNAFLDRFCDGLDAPAAQALRDLARGWNGVMRREALGDAWRAFVAQRSAIETHGGRWAARCAAAGDLAANLASFCKRLI